MRALASTSEVLAVPLQGNVTQMEYYFVELQVSGQTQALILDTGSAITAMPCRYNCTRESCGQHMYPWLDTNLPGDDFVVDLFELSYVEGSMVEGILVSDYLTLAGTRIWLEFGCIYMESAKFYRQKANGVLGLARGSFFEIMYDQKLISEKGFAVCIAPNGGYL